MEIVSENYALREATGLDIPILVAHRRKMFEDIAVAEGTVYDTEKLADMSSRYGQYLETQIPRKTLWGRLVVANEKIVASGCVTFVGWIPSPLHHNSERAYIHSVYVEPEYRGMGLCTLLMKTLCDELKTAGFFMVELHASDAGRRIYEKAGFKADTSMRLYL